LRKRDVRSKKEYYTGWKGDRKQRMGRRYQNWDGRLLMR
jgi:hypothetical protein